jgi:hypothetical protein
MFVDEIDSNQTNYHSKNDSKHSLERLDVFQVSPLVLSLFNLQ